MPANPQDGEFGGPAAGRLLAAMRRKPLTARRAAVINRLLHGARDVRRRLVGWLADRNDFATLGDGLSWSLQTVTTVGYGDLVPSSGTGRHLRHRALGDANVFVNDQRFKFTNLNTLAWVLIVLGVLQLTGGLSLKSGNTYGRVIAIVASTFGAIGALLSVGGA